MRFRGLLVLCATLLAGVAVAQSAAPSQAQQDDRWEAVSATASSSNFHADMLPGTNGSSHNPFHFKEPAKRGPVDKPPPQANDKAVVMGQQRPWQNGQPPVNCLLEPRDPVCR